MPIVKPSVRALEGRKRVLVVDDSIEARELQHLLLSRRGYEVELAVSGVDGWKKLHAEAFDLLLTDIDMPLIDGIRLVRLVRKDPALQAMPVVIVCGQDSEAVRRRSFEAGADYYVIKARVQDTLVQTVASLIGPARA